MKKLFLVFAIFFFCGGSLLVTAQRPRQGRQRQLPAATEYKFYSQAQLPGGLDYYLTVWDKPAVKTKLAAVNKADEHVMELGGNPQVVGGIQNISLADASKSFSTVKLDRTVCGYMLDGDGKVHHGCITPGQSSSKDIYVLLKNGEIKAVSTCGNAFWPDEEVYKPAPEPTPEPTPKITYCDAPYNYLDVEVAEQLPGWTVNGTVCTKPEEYVPPPTVAYCDAPVDYLPLDVARRLEGWTVNGKTCRPPVKQDCPVCPTVDIRSWASGKSRFLGGLKDAAISAGLGAVAGAAGSSGQRTKAAIISAGVSLAGQRLLQAVNPSDDRGEITINSGGATQTYQIKKNQKEVGIYDPSNPSKKLGVARWHNDAITVDLGQCREARGVKKTSNIVVIGVPQGAKPVKVDDRPRERPPDDAVRSVLTGVGTPIKP